MTSHASRDTLPDATHLVLTVNDRDFYDIAPYRVRLRAIHGPDAAALWSREQPLVDGPAERSAGTDTAWPEVVQHLDRILTAALGAAAPDVYWRPDGEEGGRADYRCALPHADDLTIVSTIVGLRDLVGGLAVTKVTAERADHDAATEPPGGAALVPADPARPALDRPEGDRPESLSQLGLLLPWLNGDDEFRYGDNPDDVMHDNTRRAGFAAVAVLAFAMHTGLLSGGNDEEVATAISDLIGDLRHLVDLLDLDYRELEERGEGHYRAELTAAPF